MSLKSRIHLLGGTRRSPKAIVSLSGVGPSWGLYPHNLRTPNTKAASFRFADLYSHISLANALGARL